MPDEPFDFRPLLPFSLRGRWVLPALVVVAWVLGCARSPSSSAAPPAPPFEVRAASTGLVFTYGDGAGFHSVERVEDVPATARATVRVEPLAADGRGLDPSQVWVADLRAPGADGRYAVRALGREAFEQSVVPVAPAAANDPTSGTPVASENASIVLYGTSWCGACRSARQYFRSRGIDFVDRDIERDPAAREEMLRKARAQGVTVRGVPVIDVRGRILPGFDRAAIDRILAGG